MSEFEGARFTPRFRYFHADGRQTVVQTSKVAIEVTKIPIRKRPCLAIETEDGAAFDILAYFSSDEAATKFIEFMDKMAVTE